MAVAASQTSERRFMTVILYQIKKPRKQRGG